MQLKKIILTAALCICVAAANAQTGGSNSSYSRFGIGHLADASSSESVSMGGTGVALRSSNRVNMINPASYAACDSLAFVCNIGMSGHFGRFSTPTASKKVRNTSFDNVNAMFRVRRGLGMSIGFVPYSSIGYSFIQPGAPSTDASSSGQGINTITSTEFAGGGGLNHAYAGLGWRAFNNFSVGANFGFLWGEYNHTMTLSFLENGTVTSIPNSPRTSYSAELRSYKIDAGVQYVLPLNNGHRLVAGATVGVGHKMTGTATVLRYTSNGDSVVRNIPKAFDVPWSYGVGLAWYQGMRWTVTADYRSELWGNCRLPQIIQNGETAVEMQAASVTGSMINRHRIGVGMEYTPDVYKSSYIHRIRYRFGASYTTPYYKVNGENGPSEYSVGCGFGFPISNGINNRSVVNVGLQWTRVQPGHGSNITEDYFKINLGITFNEQWFMKWKIR